jgi:hypothetical protein
MDLSDGHQRCTLETYLLMTLSADADVKGRKLMQTGVVRGWRCGYDL